MTRGPAKPISAFGSAMFRSPSIAKLAVTPPVVGSVSTEMNGSRARSSRASAAETLAICISDSAPSIMRAPPEHEMMMTGWRRSSAISMARVIFSPTTTPMLPPMNVYSIAATTTSRPSSCPVATITASLRPVASMVVLQPIAIGLGVGELQRVVRGEVREVLLRTRRRRRAPRRRSAALMRKWCAHFGQTLRLVSRSLL